MLYVTDFATNEVSVLELVIRKRHRFLLTDIPAARRPVARRLVNYTIHRPFPISEHTE